MIFMRNFDAIMYQGTLSDRMPKGDDMVIYQGKTIDGDDIMIAFNEKLRQYAFISDDIVITEGKLSRSYKEGNLAVHIGASERYYEIIKVCFVDGRGDFEILRLVL